jgi:hypothetical protein
MRTEQHYRRMLEQNPSASIGFTLAAAMVYAARYGICEAEHHGTDEWKSFARELRARYGENLAVDEVSAEMDEARKSAAASMLGSIGGKSTSEAKRKAVRENGKRGGRPKTK